MSSPDASMAPMHQHARPVSAFTAESLWHHVCAVLGSGLALSDATVSDLSTHARELRELIPTARLEAIDAARLARVRG